MKKNKAIVGIIMGSDSDLPVMKESADMLKKLGISCDVKILSAHRTPDAAAKFARNARKNGMKVIIAGAGGAAHLAGITAAHTTLPVIGVPMETRLDGVDSLLSTVQMPAGVPVATVAIGKAGAINAAILAAQIIGTSSQTVASRLDRYKKELVRKVEEKNRKINL
ncbi:MAG: 5-(carboxyamino)imidazole ribonucleotide mutase [Candidatus Omnitrophica bacterium]|nr:5-(carboxyamino)imidazole ribonucleotide mutase [Candidatus Omnitrophota bacterium]MDD5488179.1 5-(carboxyamino)imidazole ribonucleotide mutase [Candidatus Omnitrophota bacterium]